MKLDSNNVNAPDKNQGAYDSANEKSGDDLLKEGQKGILFEITERNLYSPPNEFDDVDTVDVKSGQDPLEDSKKGNLFDVNEKNLGAVPTEIADDGGFWPVSECHDFKSVANLTANFVPVDSHALSEAALLTEKMEYLTGNDVPQLEVPEMMVCYKENPEVDLKDICVDENMPSCERILFETDTEKDLGSLLAENDGRSELKKETKEVDISTSDFLIDEHVPERLAETNVKEDEDESVRTSPTLESAVEVFQELSDDVSKENIQLDATESSKESPLPSKVSVAEESNKLSDDCKELNLADPSGKESNPTAPVDKLSKGTVLNGSDNNGSPERDGLSSQNMSKVCDSNGVSFRQQHGHGESSFSMAGPVSGVITYSGSIPYSGSISFRSDASSASTRSFAFPILQPEWQSSPVRMAKADRRRFRKRKGWRQGLLCCRF